MFDGPNHPASDLAGNCASLFATHHGVCLADADIAFCEELAGEGVSDHDEGLLREIFSGEDFEPDHPAIKQLPEAMHSPGRLVAAAIACDASRSDDARYRPITSAMTALVELCGDRSDDLDAELGSSYRN